MGPVLYVAPGPIALHCLHHRPAPHVSDTMRVVSLLSGATEALHAMGLGHLLVGRSHECDYPPDLVLPLPQVSKALVDPSSPALAIDRSVKERSEAGLTMYALDAAQLDALRPVDVLIVQDSCRICAVSPDALDTCASACLAEGGCTVLTLCPRTLPDVLEDTIRIGRAVGEEERARQYTDQMRGRLDALAARGQTLHARPPRVAVLEWVDPLMGCGYWIPELIECGGGACALPTSSGQHTAYVTAEEVLEARPEHVLIASCGFDIHRCAREIAGASSAARAALEAIRGVACVWVCDGNRYFNRSGPSVVESAVIVAQAIAGGHPVDGEPDLRGTAFVDLQTALASVAAPDTLQPRQLPQPQQPPQPAEEDVRAAVQCARTVVAALRAGDVLTAFRLSEVSACMPLAQYEAVIVRGEDYRPLSDPAAFDVSVSDAPEVIAAGQVKVRVTAVRRAPEAAGQESDSVSEAQGTVRYDFRLAAAAEREAAPPSWLIRGVNRL